MPSKRPNLLTMTRKEELEAKLEEYDRKYDELWNAGYEPSVWWEKAQELWESIKPVSGEYHMIQDEYELQPIPEYGDKFELEEFVDCCDFGGFCDSDGEGYYATESQESTIPAVPSEIVAGYVRLRRAHVQLVCFNLLISDVTCPHSKGKHVK